MSTDKSEPRVGLIFLIGITAVLLLVFLRTGLVAYFDGIARAEENRKIVEAKPLALMSLRSDEKRRLEQGPLPIERAMQELASKGRTAAIPEIDPQPSHDLGPLQGWVRMPAVVPPSMLAASLDAGAAPAPASSAPAIASPAARPARPAARAAPARASEKKP